MNALSIYKSSAGSGKTFTLVKEYLKIVLQNPAAYRHTLAITFTNKATAEMKERIVSSLVKLSEGKADDLKKILEGELKNPKINLQERAQTVLQSVLHDYSSFAVSTIDSFFSRIIRSLAKEMQLPLKFEMEMNQDYITSRLKDMLMADIGKSDELTEWLQQFVFTKMEDDKGWNIDHEIKSIAKEVFIHRQQENENPARRINHAFIDLLKKIKYHFENQMQEFGREFFQQAHAAALDVNDFAHNKGGVAGYFTKIMEGQTGEKWVPGKRVMEAVESPEKWVSKTSFRRKEIMELAASTFIPLLKKALFFFEEHFKDYFSACEVLSMAYMAGIVSYLREKMKNYRDENDVLLMTDTNKLLKAFITGTDTPFVYEKTGNTFQHYLIDEFQDTANLQWDTILPLVINCLGSGGFVLFVGDAKQSIYRWRGGNMKLLLENIHHDLQVFSSISTHFHLDTNYRSRKEIVDFNNTFFSLAPALLPVSDDTLTKLAYQAADTIQKNHESKASGGFVSVSFLPKKDTSDQEDDVKWKDTALVKMAETIAVSIQQGYHLQDIAILVRSNKEGKMIADYLFKKGYKKISSAESLLLYTAPQIIFLMNVLKVLAFPDNKPALAEVMYYYQHSILLNTGQDLHALFYASGNKSGNNEISFLPEEWLKLKSNLATLPLYELVEKLIDIFSLNKIPDAYIQRFQDLVLEYSSKNLPSLKEFLSWWNDHKESEKLSVAGPDDINAINIISIHRAKGLQYPVVLMPFLEWNLKPKPDNLLWISSDVSPYDQLTLFPVKTTSILSKTHFADHYREELDQNYLDNLNLLYVAFTRAEEKLYITTPYNAVTEKRITNISQLLFAVINNHADWQKHLKTKNGIITLEAGDHHRNLSVLADKRTDASFDEPENISLPGYPYNQWENQLYIRVSRSYFTDEEENGVRIAIDSGLLIHETMSHIKQKSDRNQALKKIASSHLLSTDEILKLESNLDLIFNLTDKEKWFENDWQIVNESEISTQDGVLLRPDRVMLHHQQAVVVDYKTGLRDQKHFKQVQEYVTALAGIGYTQVNGYLLYLQEEQVVQVNEP